jgi:hypothetical protein
MAVKNGEAPRKREKDVAAWGWHSFGGAADVLVFLSHGGPGKPSHKAAVQDKTLPHAPGDPKKMPNEKPYPDIYRGWLDTHRTSEADQMRGLTVRYVQTGQRGFLDRAAAWSRFYRSRYYWRTDDYIMGKEGGRNIGKWVG